MGRRPLPNDGTEGDYLEAFSVNLPFFSGAGADGTAGIAWAKLIPPKARVVIAITNTLIAFVICTPPCDVSTSPSPRNSKAP